MQGTFFLCILLMFAPPVIAAFILIKRLGAIRNRKDTKSELFRQQCMELARLKELKKSEQDAVTDEKEK